MIFLQNIENLGVIAIAIKKERLFVTPVERSIVKFSINKN
jgi:hypothetical protein